MLSWKNKKGSHCLDVLKFTQPFYIKMTRMNEKIKQSNSLHLLTWEIKATRFGVKHLPF